MSEIPAPIEDALESHEAFSPIDDGHEGRNESQTEDGDGYALETTVFDTRVTADKADGKRDGAFTVTVFLPALDAAAEDTVAQVVEDGWFETLERRLEDVFSVAHTGTHEEPRLERDADEVRVILEYIAWDASEGVDDAKTLIEYVEGTFAQGIIPGYEYRGATARLLERAQSQGQQAAERDGGPPL